MSGTDSWANVGPTKTVKTCVLAYAFVLIAFGAALSGIISFGSTLHRAPALLPAPAAPTPIGASAWALNPIALLLLQVLVIIAVTRFLANVTRRFRQPGVIGEVIGGIILGPSVLGFLWPAFGSFLFAPASLANINILSQIGLVTFMFVVGLELDPNFLKTKAYSAVMISHASIIAPFLLGSSLALFLFRAYAPTGVPFSAFCLFMGIAMSITAFPVLARIIQERRLGHSSLGTMALACAAIDDFTAWCALALVVGIARQGTIRQSLHVTGLCVLYIVVMLFLVKPALSRWLETRPADESLNRKMMATSLLVMLLSAFATEAIGIHALFGAFLAGVVMPKEAVFRKVLSQRIEDFSTLLLLPLFFALSGLRTQIGLLDDLHSCRNKRVDRVR